DRRARRAIVPETSARATAQLSSPSQAHPADAHRAGRYALPAETNHCNNSQGGATARRTNERTRLRTEPVRIPSARSGRGSHLTRESRTRLTDGNSPVRGKSRVHSHHLRTRLRARPESAAGSIGGRTSRS